jgi:hypothetical protein
MQRLGNDSDGTIGNATKKIGYKLLYYCGMVYKQASWQNQPTGISNLLPAVYTRDHLPYQAGSDIQRLFSALPLSGRGQQK